MILDMTGKVISDGEIKAQHFIKISPNEKLILTSENS